MKVMTRVGLAIIALAVMAGSAVADTGDIETRRYDIRAACFSIALDVRAEDEGTANHAQRLQLANAVLTGGSSLSDRIAEVAAAKVWSGVNWDEDGGVTRAQMKTHFEGVWDDVALAKYGE